MAKSKLASKLIKFPLEKIIELTSEDTGVPQHIVKDVLYYQYRRIYEEMYVGKYVCIQIQFLGSWRLRSPAKLYLQFNKYLFPFLRYTTKQMKDYGYNPRNIEQYRKVVEVFRALWGLRGKVREYYKGLKVPNRSRLDYFKRKRDEWSSKVDDRF